jgi:hypothetical protein
VGTHTHVHTHTHTHTLLEGMKISSATMESSVESLLKN